MSVFRTKQLVERELAREEQPQDHDAYDDGADDEEEDADVAADEEEGADFGLPRARDGREEPVDFLSSSWSSRSKSRKKQRKLQSKNQQ